MSSTWETRDLPVLRAIVEIEDETGEYVQVGDISERTGLDETQVQRAVGALSREYPRLISVIDASSAAATFYMAAGHATGEARRKVGTWPTPESLADRIVAALEDTASNGETEEERTRAQKMLDGAKGVGKGVLTGVIVKALSGEL
jgi:hypothetical protein